MSEPTLYLGIDVGTQSTKALVVDVDAGVIVGRASKSYGLIEGLPDGAAEQHPHTWEAALCSVTQDLWAQGIQADAIRGVGISGQQHGLVLLDSHLEVLRPAKLWCDTRTSTEAEELAEALGYPVPVGFTASKIAWVMRHEPEVWVKTQQLLLPKDWVVFRLTGMIGSEAGDASGIGFFDPKSRDYDWHGAGLIDARLPDRLPSLLAPGEDAGTVSEAAAKRTGLKEGTMVSTGGGDNMMSAIGSGAIEPGVFVASLGTSGTIFSFAEEAIIDPEGLIAPFCDSTGGWLPLLCVMNLTGVTQEVVAAFRPGLSAPEAHAELTQLAAQEPIGSNGLMWLPYLSGERVPNLPNATGTLLGMRPGLLRPGCMYRAALEGTSLNLVWGLHRMTNLGLEPKSLRVVGGGSSNDLWCQILADASGLPVQRLTEPESAALGAAIHAAWTKVSAGTSRHSLHHFVETCVHKSGPAFTPNPTAHTDYLHLLGHFQHVVSWHYPVSEPG